MSTENRNGDREAVEALSKGSVMTTAEATETIQAMVAHLARKAQSALDRAAKARTPGAQAGYDAAAEDYIREGEALMVALKALKEGKT